MAPFPPDQMRTGGLKLVSTAPRSTDLISGDLLGIFPEQPQIPAGSAVPFNAVAIDAVPGMFQMHQLGIRFSVCQCCRSSLLSIV